MKLERNFRIVLLGLLTFTLAPLASADPSLIFADGMSASLGPEKTTQVGQSSKVERNFRIALLGLLTFAFAPLASADPSLILTDGTNTVTMSSPTGVKMSGAVGDRPVDVTTAVASAPNSAFGAPFPPRDLNSVDVYSRSGRSAPHILFTDDDLTLRTPSLDKTMGGVNGVGNILTYSAYYDTGNVLLGRRTSMRGTATGGGSAPANLNNILGPFGTGACCIPGRASGPWPGAAPSQYSLTEMVVVSATSGVVSNDSVNAEPEATPEPSTILLLGSCLLLLSKLFRNNGGTSDHGEKT